jgi:hypothetical protein
MKYKSDKQRKAIFANLNKGGVFDHLKGTIKVKQLEKEMEEPILFKKKKKNEFARVDQRVFRPTVDDILEDIQTGDPQIGIGPGAGIGG